MLSPRKRGSEGVGAGGIFHTAKSKWKGPARIITSTLSAFTAEEACSRHNSSNTLVVHAGEFFKMSQLTNLQLNEVKEWDEKTTFSGF